MDTGRGFCYSLLVEKQPRVPILQLDIGIIPSFKEYQILIFFFCEEPTGLTEMLTRQRYFTVASVTGIYDRQINAASKFS